MISSDYLDSWNPYTNPNKKKYIKYSFLIMWVMSPTLSFLKNLKLDREWNDWDYVNDMLENELSQNHIQWLNRKKPPISISS